jgi:hypothetical protein
MGNRDNESGLSDLVRVCTAFWRVQLDSLRRRPIETVKRQTTVRELGAFFEKYDFNAFPVVEDGR